MPEYRALKSKHASILDMVKNPEVAAEITMQPIRAFDVDAGIIFADILTLPEAMGLKLEFVKDHGPVIHNPIRSMADVEALRVCDPNESLKYTIDAIRLVKKDLSIPLIGFSGAPFTLACYAIEGGASRDYLLTKRLMHQEPRAWHELMEKMSASISAYLRAQIEAGADALQLFDSWAGALSPDDYRDYVLPYVQQIVKTVATEKNIPFIYFSTGTTGLLELIQQTGAQVIGVDWRVELAQAWKKLGDGVAIQGNLDPALLLMPFPEIKKQAARILDSVRGKPGHIFNLGHGVLEPTPVEHVQMLIDFAHSYSKIN